MNADENLLNGLIPIEPSNVEFDEDAPPHARFYQVLAWQTGTHPLVYDNQIWESLDEKDEVGHRQVMIIKVDGTDVQVIGVDTNGKSSKTGLGELDTIPVLDLHPEGNGTRGWILKSVVVPVNANGEAKPGVHIPYPQTAPSHKVTSSGVQSPSKHAPAKPTTVGSATPTLAKSAVGAVDKSKRSAKSKGDAAAAPMTLEDRANVFGKLAANGTTLDANQTHMISDMIDAHGFIACMKTTREVLRELNVPSGTNVVQNVKDIFFQEQAEAKMEKQVQPAK